MSDRGTPRRQRERPSRAPAYTRRTQSDPFVEAMHHPVRWSLSPVVLGGNLGYGAGLAQDRRLPSSVKLGPCGWVISMGF